MVQHFRTSLVALGQLMLVGLGLAFVAVPQSALFVQEAPARSFGAVTAFRTTCGQLGFANPAAGDRGAAEPGEPIREGWGDTLLPGA